MHYCREKMDDLYFLGYAMTKSGVVYPYSGCIILVTSVNPNNTKILKNLSLIINSFLFLPIFNMFALQILFLHPIYVGFNIFFLKSSGITFIIGFSFIISNAFVKAFITLLYSISIFTKLGFLRSKAPSSYSGFN